MSKRTGPGPAGGGGGTGKGAGEFGNSAMTPFKTRLQSVADLDAWSARTASLTAKIKATKAVWFPPRASDADEVVGSAEQPAAQGSKKAARTTKRATGTTKKAAKRAAKKAANKPTADAGSPPAKKSTSSETEA